MHLNAGTWLTVNKHMIDSYTLSRQSPGASSVLDPSSVKRVTSLTTASRQWPPLISSTRNGNSTLRKWEHTIWTGTARKHTNSMYVSSYVTSQAHIQANTSLRVRHPCCESVRLHVMNRYKRLAETRSTAFDYPFLSHVISVHECIVNIISMHAHAWKR